ncbi:hypothetical protein Sste5346_007213 [Sporothrix stenoceras]|uniref:CUE domain-containing protein n=1 Tax=Sporothrix stenoceras TaxID=5173 RepID=A0ABR3YWH1_9PEZI
MARRKKSPKAPQTPQSPQAVQSPQTPQTPQTPSPQPKAVEKSPEDQLAELVEKYGQFLEESIIILTFQDHGFEVANEFLASLAENVFSEEASGFDPSGLQGTATDGANDASEGSSYHTPVEGPSQVASISGHGSGSTSGSQYTPLSAGGGSRSSAVDDWSAVTNDLPSDGSSTLAILRDAFPTVKDSDIKRALKESDDDVDRASDVLLNLEHLIETGQRPKGIDGFAVDDDDAYEWGSRKKKNNSHNNKATWSKNHREKRLALDYKLAPLGLDGSYEIDDGSKPAPKRGSSQPFRDTTARERRQGNAQLSLYDAIVDKQSKDALTVDLHNVPVKDGIRIAMERTRYWWAHLGEDRVRKARENPLRVVTGVGLHSPEGYSRLNTGVEAALKREGWKFHDGFGYYDVTGKTIAERTS